MEDKDFKIEEDLEHLEKDLKEVEEDIETEEEETLENLSEEIDTRELLNITIDGEDVSLLLESLKEYTNFLMENKKRTNSIVIDQGFNKKINAKIKRADELRFLIKKQILIVDKEVEIYTIEDDGQVIGIETYEKTEDGTVIKEAKPHTVGSTPDLPIEKQKEPIKTSVQTVFEES